MIGASLSEPHTSVTALRTRVCMLACWFVGLLVCLDRPLTVNFKWAHSNISRWLNVHARWRGLQLSHWEWAWRATARLQGRREREREWRWFKLNALAARMASYFLNYGTTLTIAWQGRLRVTDSRMYAGFRYVRSYIARIPLLAYCFDFEAYPMPV